MWDTDVKPRDPPTFAGRTSDDPEVWIGQVSNFFRLVGGSKAKQVAYASTLLTGVAQTWWQRLVKAGKEPRSWRKMAAQLVSRFSNVCKADAAMANLMSIHQKKGESTHEYICRFENELDKVESFDENWLLKIFIWGLPADQAALVSQRRPRDLSRAFRLARDAALAAQMSRRPGGSGKKEDAGGQKGTGRGQSNQQSVQAGRGAGSSGGTMQHRPNTVFVNAQGGQQRGGGGNLGRGRGQAGRPSVPPQASYVVVQSNQRQPGGSGQRGRGSGNQRKPRVAAMATIDKEAGGGQDAVQHAAVIESDASLHQGQGN